MTDLESTCSFLRLSKPKHDLRVQGVRHVLQEAALDGHLVQQEP